MNKRDPDGFVTLHTGRPPILMRVAYLLAMAVSVALFARVTDAKGQVIVSGGCSLGSVAFTSTEENCKVAGGHWLPLTYSAVTITNPQPRCDEGWTLVLAPVGYLCAGELRTPK